ncbi:sensor histidine kinase [Yinghuangia seranimata]|uniref:sensor histidine kinase n=1 Tax=Yinghuangia seranimata TaxID=408067 RepID=UPI00248B5457|nr:sensor histidine kinase [Yinghuangia seranimata]MDI2128552.1 sensor histidine kinase [Yinghuangia seranimata]
MHLHPPRAIALAGGCLALAALALEHAAPGRSTLDAAAPVVELCALAGAVITLAPRRGPWVVLALPVLTMVELPVSVDVITALGLAIAVAVLGVAVLRAAPWQWRDVPVAALAGVAGAALYAVPSVWIPTAVVLAVTVLVLLTPPLAVLIAVTSGRTDELERLTRRLSWRVPVAALGVAACLVLAILLRPVLPASGLLVVYAAGATHVAIAVWSHSRGRRLAEQAARHEAVLEAAILVLSDETADPTDALCQVAELAARELGVDGVSVELDTVAGEYGRTVEPPIDVALVCRGQDLGRLHIYADAPLDTRTLSTVDRLARQLAAFAYAVLRLEEARAAERELLRRELHDGVGHALAAAVMRLDPDRNPEALRSVLEPAHAQVRAALDDLRAVVRGAAPPPLVRDGLADALRALTRDLDSPAVLLTFHGDCGAVTEPVQRDVYRIVQEALTNARRHAHATRVFVSVRTTDRLNVEIVDDGRGLPSVLVPGTGLASIRGRVHGMGGTCSIGRAPGGGTRVAFSVPLRDGAGAS